MFALLLLLASKASAAAGVIVLAIIELQQATRERSFPPSGTAWTRLTHNPVMRADATWEGIAEGHPCVCEPDPMWIPEEGRWRMYYRGGWGVGGIGVAFSVDGLTWTKYAKNPIFGSQVSSGFAASAMQPWVVRVNTSSWLLFASSARDSKSQMVIATSPDGLAWLLQNSSVPVPLSKTIFGNRAVWQEGSGQWVMLQEVGPSPWEIYLYRSADSFTWKLYNQGNPLTDLQRTPGGMYGGPSLANVDGELRPRDDDGIYHLWYHASSGQGNLPTDIYHASSEDLLRWNVTPAGPVLQHSGKDFEFDQVADPSPVMRTGQPAFLFYDGDNNVVGTASIGGAVWTGQPKIS